jgi:hypothetical protein
MPTNGGPMKSITILMTTIDPRDWFETRRLAWMPSHFARVSIDSIDIFIHGEAEAWIAENTQGRYAVITCAVQEKNKLLSRVYAGFEDPSEATYFTLSFLSKHKDRKFHNFF